MPTKTGAGDNPQEYDKNTGRYEKGTSDSDNGDKDFFRTAERTIEKGQTQTKINKVHIEVEKDNVLPELNEKELQAMGITESKPVLLKKSSIERNLSEHGDIKPEDFDFIIGNTLYSPDKVVKGKNPDKDYYSFIKELRVSKRNGKPVHGVVLLDVDKEKDHFEVVHWHWVKDKHLKSI